MNVKQLLFFSSERIFNDRKNALFSILLLSLSFFLIGMLMVSRALASYAWDDCNTILKQGITGTGLISIEQYNTQEAMDFMSAAWQTGKFESLGSFTGKMGVDDRLFELRERQRQFSNPDLNLQYLWWINIDETVLDLCDLEYAQRENISDEKRNSDDWFGIILGGNFSDIPVGTIYEEELIPGVIWKYEVVGILKKNTRMVANNVLVFGKGSNFQSSILLDDYVLRINTKKPLTPSWAYTMKGDLKLSEGKRILMELAQQKDLNVRFAELSVGFELDESDQKVVIGVLMQILVLVMTTTFFINLFVFLISYLNSLEESGIFYACGFSMKDMIWIYVIETVIKFGISFLVSWLAFFIYMRIEGGTTMVMQQGIDYLLYQIALPTIFISALIFLLAVCLIPIWIICTSKPVSMLRKLKG